MSRRSKASRQRQLETRLGAVTAERDALEARTGVLDDELQVLNSKLFKQLLEDDEIRRDMYSMADKVTAALDESGRYPYKRDERGAIYVGAHDLEEIRSNLHKVLDEHLGLGPRLEEMARNSTRRDLKPATFRRIALNAMTTFIVRESPPREPGDEPAGWRYTNMTPEPESMARAIRADATRLNTLIGKLRDEGRQTTTQMQAVEGLLRIAPRVMGIAMDDKRPRSERNAALHQLADVRMQTEEVIRAARTVLGLTPIEPRDEADAVYDAQPAPPTDHDIAGAGVLSRGVSQPPDEVDWDALGAARTTLGMAGAQAHTLPDDTARLLKTPGALTKAIDDSATFQVHVSTAMGFTRADRDATLDWFDRRKADGQLKAVMRREVWPSELPRDVGWKPACSGLTDRWDDQQLQQLGLAIWQACGGAGVRREDAEAATYAWIRHLYQSAPIGKMASALRFAHFAGAWAVHAFQKVVTTHTYAAALMCSDAHREALQALELQWRAFMVVVPNGLLTVRSSVDDRVLLDYQRILVTILSDGEAQLILYDPTGGEDVAGRALSQVNAAGLASLLYEDPDDMTAASGSKDDPLPGYEDALQRAVRCAKRLVVGLLLTMQDPRNLGKSRKQHGGERRRVGDEPEHRVTYVGRPLQVDCRPAVQRYLTTGKGKNRGPQTVQTLVRGHHKTQPYGPKSSLRKVIWREPFWRGPDDAPILTRPKAVSGGVA